MTTTKPSRTFVTTAACLSLLLGAAACNQTPDGLDKRWLLEADVDVLDFGAVELPQTSPMRALTLTNTGRSALQLGALSSATLGVEAPFTFLPEASTCTTGDVLDAGQRCILAFAFTPSLNVTSTDAITVSWRSIRDNPDREETFSQTLSLRGEGSLNCQADPSWADAYGEGRGRALTANEADHGRGYDAGQAKDHDDGHRTGHRETYGASYDSAYRDAYAKAYDHHYEDGYDRGWSVYADTFGACSAGSNDGVLDGSAWGEADGRDDGAEHGLYDGVTDGSDAAWARLEDAESWGGVLTACENAYAYLYGGTATVAPPPPTAEDDVIAGLCEDAGFAEHRDTSAYDVGFSEGLRDNDEYQSGLRKGRMDGTSEGVTDGTRQGVEDGRAHGYDDGAEQGRIDAEDDAYAHCYDSAYVTAYARAYDVAYGAHYWANYDVAFADEYDIVMASYYADYACDDVLFGS